MKKIILSLVFLLFFFTDVFAHKLILTVYGNDDDTITIEGEFDTGASAVGALVRLETLNTGDVLFQKRLPQESELVVKIPEEPYQIVLDGGPGHISVEKGIAPEKGFSIQPDKKKNVNLSKTGSVNFAFVISITGAFCLLFLTLFISMKNTNKILKAIADNSTLTILAENQGKTKNMG